MNETLRIRRWKQLNKGLKSFLLYSEIHFLFRSTKEDEYIYALYLNKKLIGYAWTQTEDGYIYLLEFEIKAQYRGKGYGKALLEQILSEQPKIALDATKQSVRFWRKHGLKRRGQEEDGLTPMTNFKPKITSIY